MFCSESHIEIFDQKPTDQTKQQHNRVLCFAFIITVTTTKSERIMNARCQK